MAKTDGLIEEAVTEWVAPEPQKDPDARILTMPNIPQPLHGCLEGCAEVLTPDGWQRIDTLSKGDTVMCWSNGSLFFDEVLATIETDVPYAYKIGFQKAKNFDMLYSPGHRIPMVEKIYRWGRKGRNKYETPKEVLRVKTAEEYIPNTARSFYTAGRGTGPVEHLSADERLLIAIQADGYLVRHNYKHNNLYKYRISISKVRKMSRLRELLEKTSFKWRELSGDDGYKKFNIWVPKESKTFSNVFQWNMPYTKAREFIQELWEWDGHVGASAFGTQRALYNSTRYDNIAFVQAIAAQAGYTTNTRADIRSSRNACWTVEFIDKGTRGCGSTKKEKVKYDDKMYCITVPSSFFLVKYHNIVMVTGNSGLQPRTIVGPSKWNFLRKKCYMDAHYKCQACGADCSEKGKAQAHELFSIDYATGTSKFERLVCLCEECVDADTEVLTSDGWKKIPTVTTNDKAACWDKDGSIRFDHPIKTIVSHKDKAIKITKGDATLYFSEGHRLPLKVASKQSSTSGEVRDILAGDYHASHYYNWMTGGNTTGEGKLTPDERVYITIEADGCLTWDKEDIGTRSSADGERQRERNSRYGSEDYRYTYRVSLSKTRKIERLKELLSNSTLKYEITKETSDSYCDFNIWTNVECKHFANCFSQEMPAEKALEFIEELVFWDGTFANGETAWYTHKLEEVAFVQGVAAQCNIRTQVSTVNRIGNLRKGQWKTPYERLTYAVSFKSIRNEICAREMKEEEVDWGKDMYCITTPTSYFIARRDNLVFVTGNCHLRFIHSGRMFTMLKKNNPLMPASKVLEGIEHGFKVIKEYNDTHDEPIKPYAALLTGLEDERTAGKTMELIEKYDIKFYSSINKKMGLARWQDWKMVWRGKEYRTPYADENAWEHAMEEQHKDRIENPFSGGVFDEIDKILKEA